MSWRYFRLTPLNPLISRDSRPFGMNQGNRARSLNWLSQSVLAGAFRTAIWKEDSRLTPEQLKTVEVSGGFPLLDGRAYFPRPLDALILSQDEERRRTELLSVRPMEQEGLGVQMPLEGISPAAPLDMPDEDFKPEPGDAFWSAETMTRWLERENSSKCEFELDSLPYPAKEERTNVTIEPISGVAEDTKLFSTVNLNFNVKVNAPIPSEYWFEQFQVAARVSCNEHDLLSEEFLVPLGGERRLTRVEENDDTKFWEPSSSLISKVKGCKRLRMVLATPAIFSKGWLPGWLEEKDGKVLGTIPWSGVTVCLRSAVVGRWRPISGWSYEKGKNGPKALRRMVPEGSVYFFEVEGGEADLEKLWLSSVCDDLQDQRDGFGLALWGPWGL